MLLCRREVGAILQPSKRKHRLLQAVWNKGTNFFRVIPTRCYTKAPCEVQENQLTASGCIKDGSQGALRGRVKYLYPVEISVHYRQRLADRFDIQKQRSVWASTFWAAATQWPELDRGERNMFLF